MDDLLGLIGRLLLSAVLAVVILAFFWYASNKMIAYNFDTEVHKKLDGRAQVEVIMLKPDYDYIRVKTVGAKV